MFRRLEAFLERALEGPAGRMGARLQPVTLAKRLERAMDENRSFRQDGVVVPNAYVISLHPDDYAPFATYHASLEDDLAREARERARASNFRMVSRPWVQLRADESVARGEIRVLATVSESHEPLTDAAAEAAPDTQTAVFEQGETGGVGRATLLVRTGKGDPVRFELSAPLIGIGRDHDNDLIVDDPGVSRHHCQLKLQQGLYALTDLGSSNGTAVNGRRVSEVALRDGDVIALGGTTVEYRVGK